MCFVFSVLDEISSVIILTFHFIEFKVCGSFESKEARNGGRERVSPQRKGNNRLETCTKKVSSSGFSS